MTEMAPAAVIFDLDETLLDRTTSLRSFLAEQYGRFADHLGEVDFDVWERRFIELDARGSVPKSRVYPTLLAEFGGRPDAAAMLTADYATGCCRHARAFPGMAELLGALRSHGVRLGIITNGEGAFQRRHIEALHLESLVDVILISEEEGLRKPDPEIFRLAARRLGVEPGECVFIGDNPMADVIGAADAGMQAVWFRCGQEWPGHLPPNPGRFIDGLQEALSFIQ
jgi:putative hydrolase of the HAD superfamily